LRQRACLKIAHSKRAHPTGGAAATPWALDGDERPDDTSARALVKYWGTKGQLYNANSRRQGRHEDRRRASRTRSDLRSPRLCDRRRQACRTKVRRDARARRSDEASAPPPATGEGRGTPARGARRSGGAHSATEGAHLADTEAVPRGGTAVAVGDAHAGLGGLLEGARIAAAGACIPAARSRIAAGGALGTSCGRRVLRGTSPTRYVRFSSRASRSSPGPSPGGGSARAQSPACPNPTWRVRRGGLARAPPLHARFTPACSSGLAPASARPAPRSRRGGRRSPRPDRGRWDPR